MAGNDPKKTKAKHAQAGIHQGHRQRLQARFIHEGLQHFDDHQALELLLFHVIPRADTNPIAHRLLQRFGSFSAVLNASRHDLQTVDGIGQKAAFFLSTLAPLCQKYFFDSIKQQPIQLNSAEKAFAYMQPLLATRTTEAFYVLCLDSQCGVIASVCLSEGIINETAVYPRKVVEIALQHQAASVLLAHNHPSGNAKASKADTQITQQIATVMRALDIPVIDHIIVARDQFFSFASETDLL